MIRFLIFPHSKLNSDLFFLKNSDNLRWLTMTILPPPEFTLASEAALCPYRG